MSILLYHYWRSSCSWRVRWALELKEISFQTQSVNLLEKEQQSAEYKQHNPMGLVPALVSEGKTFTESVAIIEWLEETFPQRRLFPEDKYLRAKARQLAETINAGTQPLQNLGVMNRHSTDADEKKEWSRHWISRGLQAYEDILQKEGFAKHQFSMADKPMYPDLFLIPQIYNANRFGVQMQAFPQLEKIWKNAQENEACRRSAPEAYEPK